jgi:hypothetical protein
MTGIPWSFAMLTAQCTLGGDRLTSDNYPLSEPNHAQPTWRGNANNFILLMLAEMRYCGCPFGGSVSRQTA